MSEVLLFVKEDFGQAVKKAAHEALEISLETFPDLNYSPWPKTTTQLGSFNIPGFMYGFAVDSEFWERRNLSVLIAKQIQEMPTVSHTSILPNAHHYDSPKIEGLNLKSSDYFVKISVTSCYDAHCGYIKSLNDRIKNAQKNGADPQADIERLEREQVQFSHKQTSGKIPEHLPPAWDKYPLLTPLVA